ncbi:MAG: GerMN domain-containing protein [Clostridia bacterium]
MKRLKLTLLLSVLMLSLCACSTMHSNPLIKAEATAVPGLSMDLHAASASDTNTDEFVATLYFRYLNQPMLAKESRTLTVKRDESNELALLNALLQGPSAGHMELRRLFPENIQVENVTSKNQVLFVTLSNTLLSNADLPADWQGQADWATEAPLLRELQMQSIVASVTECFAYTGVQIMIGHNNPKESLRLDNSYFLNELSGLSDPLIRNEALLLTPQNTAACILDAWQKMDLETLYAYVAPFGNGVHRPTMEAFLHMAEAYPAIGDFTCTGGSISQDGSRAVVCASLSLHQNGVTRTITAYPVHLMLDNGIWKISYDSLLSLMSIQ